MRLATHQHAPRKETPGDRRGDARAFLFSSETGSAGNFVTRGLRPRQAWADFKPNLLSMLTSRSNVRSAGVRIPETARNRREGV